MMSLALNKRALTTFTYQVHQPLHCIFMAPNTLTGIKSIRHGVSETKQGISHRAPDKVIVQHILFYLFFGENIS